MAKREPLGRDRAQLLVIDVQGKLLPHIENHAAVLAQASRMIQAAGVLELPVTISEQYVAGLGPTDPAILAAAGDAPRLEKLTFSCAADEGLRSRLTGLHRRHVLMVGIEAHVCVQQTALDLLDSGDTPVILADAVGSRRGFDRDIALARLRDSGVTVTTVESAIYELMKRAGTDQFKRMLPIVR